MAMLYVGIDNLQYKMELLDEVINQSFNDDLARYNNKPIQINSNDKSGIAKIFKNIGGLKDDCNICYENCKCIQCYQCSFKYCQDCLIKVVSEFTKCSSCNVEFKNNSQKIEDYNKKLIQKLIQKEKEKEKEKNKNTQYNQNSKNTKNVDAKNIDAKNSKNYLDNYLGDYALDDDYPDYIDYDYNINHKNGIQNKDSNQNKDSYNLDSGDNGDYGDDLDDYEIEQISILLETQQLNHSRQPALQHPSINRITINPPSQNVSQNANRNASQNAGYPIMIQPSFEQMQLGDNYLETCFKARTNCNIPDIKYDCRLFTSEFPAKLSLYLSTITREPRTFNMKWIKIANMVNIFVMKHLTKCKYDPSSIKPGNKDKSTVKILKKIEKIVLE